MIEEAVSESEFESNYPRPSAEAGSQAKDLQRIGTLLTFLWILHVAAQNYQLPLKLFLKDHLGLKAVGVASVVYLGQIAWNTKPIYAWICDSFPIRNRRRVPYLLSGSAVAVAGYLSLFLLPKTVGFIGTSLAISQLGMVFCSCSLGGLMVETGNKAGTLAKLSSIRGTIWNGMSLVTGPVAGFLAARWIGLTWGMCIACCSITVLFVLSIKEPPAPRMGGNPVALIVEPLKGLFLHRNFWFAILAAILLNCAPGFGTPLLFFQRNVLKFSPQTIGNFGLIGGSCAVLSGLACVALSKHWPLKRLIIVATVVNAVGTLAYLQYNSLGHAVMIEGVNGFISAPSQIVIFLIAGYAIPRGFEAIAYSVMMAVSNAVAGFSDVSGSFLTDKLHWSFHQLVWVNALTTLAILVLVPFMPKSMLARKDAS